jgi:hypothetical protein
VFVGTSSAQAKNNNNSYANVKFWHSVARSEGTFLNLFLTKEK